MLASSPSGSALSSSIIPGSRVAPTSSSPALQADGLELWVWERGCGLTLACGTGACATAVAAVATGRHAAGEPLRVALPGGVLRITVDEGLARVWMEGPAVEVFSGSVEI